MGKINDERTEKADQGPRQPKGPLITCVEGMEPSGRVISSVTALGARAAVSSLSAGCSKYREIGCWRSGPFALHAATLTYQCSIRCNNQGAIVGNRVASLARIEHRHDKDVQLCVPVGLFQ